MEVVEVGSGEPIVEERMQPGGGGIAERWQSVMYEILSARVL